MTIMIYRQANVLALDKKKRTAFVPPRSPPFPQFTPHKEAIMSIALPRAPGKPKQPIRFIPSQREGLKILYKIKDSGSSLKEIAQVLSLGISSVSRVVSGRRRSARIEAEIARILGKADWNEVVLEARSEVQKKPVAVIRREMARAREARLKAAKNALASHIREGMAGVDVVDLRRRRRGA
jgi:transcriptional regulator with XRE-family HTH domain